jgi:hypothetical protein
MRRYVSSNLFLSLIFTVSTLIFVALAINQSMAANSEAGQDQSATIINETEALQVVETKISEARPDLGEKSYLLTLKNVSNKEIVAWAIQYPSGQMQYAGAAMGGGLSPGESRTVEVYDVSGNRVKDKKITIKLAMFDDGSSEGDFQVHKDITDSRMASKLQTERINAIIEEALLSRPDKPNQAKEKEWLEHITSEISNLPERGSPDKPRMAMGLLFAKQNTLSLLKALGEWEETRHNDPVRAGKILKERDAVVVGTSDLTDGLTKIVRHNEWLIGKQKANKGGSNEK